MATYEPRIDWLREQLRSLNEQTYPNLCLYVRDDASSETSYKRIKQALKACITAFPFELHQNSYNLGSTMTFEQLTREAEGDYFAYCDQDDVWLPDKLEQFEKKLRERKNAALVCSDMYIVDQTGEIVADSITKIRRHHRLRSGENLAEGLLFSNFVTGCAMMVRAEQAKAAIPFCPYMFHDHYLAFCCARIGEIALIQRPLIRYRIHGANQSRDVAGVSDKESYYRLRIEQTEKRLRWLCARFGAEKKLGASLTKGLRWIEARKKYFLNGSDMITVWKYRRFERNTALFELISRLLSPKMFMALIELKRGNKI